LSPAYEHDAASIHDHEGKSIGREAGPVTLDPGDMRWADLKEIAKKLKSPFFFGVKDRLIKGSFDELKIFNYSTYISQRE
jgi:hypothetical protein